MLPLIYLLVYATGGNILWLIVPDDDLKKNILVIVDIMDQSRQIGSVPLYVDYSIGGSITYNIKDYYHS